MSLEAARLSDSLLRYHRPGLRQVRADSRACHTGLHGRGRCHEPVGSSFRRTRWQRCTTAAVCVADEEGRLANVSYE